MTTSLQIERMSRAEKLQTMEAIRADPSRDDAALESPAWHHAELKRTEAGMASDQEQIRDWTDAKQELRKRFE